MLDAAFKRLNITGDGVSGSDKDWTIDPGCCPEPKCGVKVHGEKILLDISGVLSGGCILWPAPDGDGLYHLLALPNGYQTEYELITTSETTWASAFHDTTYVVFSGTSDSCDPPDPPLAGSLRAEAACVDAPESEHNGKLRVVVQLNSAHPIYAAYFDAPNSAQPNALILGQPAIGSPVGFIALFSEGNGSISKG